MTSNAEAVVDAFAVFDALPEALFVFVPSPIYSGFLAPELFPFVLFKLCFLCFSYRISLNCYWSSKCSSDLPLVFYVLWSEM